MVIIITGATHTGKTLLAQKMLEKYHFPYLSIDHLKMGLIRSGQTSLTPEDDEKLTPYLWAIVKEMIKTAIENEQNLIVEGCYIPFDWRRDFDSRYLSEIRFICLAMTDRYIEKHFKEITGLESVIEKRFADTRCTIEGLKKDNQRYLKGFKRFGEEVVLIDCDYKMTIQNILKEI